MSFITETIETFLNESIVHQQNATGGSIANSSFIKTSKGHTYFLKQVEKKGMLSCEANSLNEIKKANCIKSPDVILLGKDFLLLEYIPTGSKTNDSFTLFGEQLANLHKFHQKQFGFYEDNYIGLTPQINTASDSWSEFYFNHRLLYQYKLAEKNGYINDEFRKAFQIIEKRIDRILEGSEEEPSLLHGDLWGGNYLIDLDGQAVLIDPAVHYGHRESDIAMTKLFGGFPTLFYKAYQCSYPLKDGFEYREKIYQLYHILNHMNMFGKSYYNQCIQLMHYYK